MPFNRGDVVLALFPDSNLRTAKRRPVMIVQADHLSTELPQVIVAMVTSNMHRAGHPSRVAVVRESPEGRQSGLIMDSVIMADNLSTLLEKELDRKLGTLNDMTAVDAALRHTLGL
jgi:mRNA interferase MazF